MPPPSVHNPLNLLPSRTISSIEEPAKERTVYVGWLFLDPNVFLQLAIAEEQLWASLN
jgi:hypothetical protein